MNKILLFFVGVLLISPLSYAQEFYVSAVGNIPPNRIFRYNISNSSEITENFCPPTVIAGEYYTDIAIDSQNNMYYVTATGLLYKKNASEVSCEFLGDFTTAAGDTINSLVADSGNYIYAIGSTSTLYKYDISNGTFMTMGDLPAGEAPAGDLFFYDHKLFLTTISGILEINMVNPSVSCPFMKLNVSNPYAAFSIDYGTYSKAYILSSFFLSTTLYEVDMINKQLGNPIRTYSQLIYGAATLYNQTSVNAQCNLNLGVRETPPSDLYFNVTNPAKNRLIIQTNIDRNEIFSIQLFDTSGRLIKDFPNQERVSGLDISDISNGLYLLIVNTKKGEKYTKKLIIGS
ncbi:T9SS type A sorting domain-containing protein [Chryseobacterium sp.]|uniref:T9SS type A sorting domain-containing protein n=1 Tax=Chryseobacterium sp. TaxID=1871047 RepID=UPI0025C42F21|nr:T9SS type A sorting domain-containing protein [Chryseobacterium sp.]MBV8326399.1 T9SS type A sorting domain-containing protein [Chryseobacterium sp.]